MAVNGFTFWRTYWDVAQDLTPNQQGTLYRAICEYMFADNDMEDDMKGSVRTAFKALKPNIKTSKKRSSAGVKGGKQTPSKTEANAKQNASKTQAKPKQDKDKDKDKDKGESGALGIPDTARSQLIELGLLRGERDAQ